MSENGLRLLGLGLRAGTVVIGVSRVRAALKGRELALVVVAGDHGHRTAEKVVRLARGLNVPVVNCGARAAELGARLGSGPIQAAGVRDRHLAAGILNGLMEL